MSASMNDSSKGVLVHENRYQSWKLPGFSTHLVPWEVRTAQNGTPQGPMFLGVSLLKITPSPGGWFWDMPDSKTRQRPMMCRLRVRPKITKERFDVGSSFPLRPLTVLPGISELRVHALLSYSEKTPYGLSMSSSSPSLDQNFTRSLKVLGLSKINFAITI
jgi:hypothetical protein